MSLAMQPTAAMAAIWPFGQAPPAPERPVYAIGDVHGCDAAMCDLLERIERDMGARGLRDAVIVLLGDMVDRGPDAGAVLIRARALQQAMPGHVVCLAGDHERAMIAALDTPNEAMPTWLAMGGDATLRSFGVIGAQERHPHDVARALSDALPAGMEEWVRHLPLMWRSGTLVAVHAALDPARPPEGQVVAPLRGHPRFALRPRADGLWVVHGHRVVAVGRASRGAISCDTGAFAGGPLTAAHIGPDGEIAFLTAPPA